MEVEVEEEKVVEEEAEDVRRGGKAPSRWRRRDGINGRLGRCEVVVVEGGREGERPRSWRTKMEMRSFSAQKREY